MTEIELVNDISVNLIHSNISDEMVAMAAWVSHDKDSEERLSNEKHVASLIDFLWRNKHHSPFEHGSMTVKVDVPLFVRSEWHRHRTQSYNEVSGRYTMMKPRFYVGSAARIQKGKPGEYFFIEAEPEQTAIYLKSKERAAQFAWDEYQLRLDAGIAKEQAREDLPLSLMTQFYATANLRNWLNFLSLRTDPTALQEIRFAAYEVEKLIKDRAPLTFEAFRKHQP